MNWIDAKPPGLPKSILLNDEGCVIAEIGSYQEIKDISQGKSSNLTLYVQGRVFLESFLSIDEARSTAEASLEGLNNERLLEVHELASTTPSRSKQNVRNVEVLLSVVQRINPALDMDAQTFLDRMHQELSKYDVGVPKKTLTKAIHNAFKNQIIPTKDQTFDNLARAIASTVYITLSDRLKNGAEIADRGRPPSDKLNSSLSL